MTTIPTTRLGTERLEDRSLPALLGFCGPCLPAALNVALPPVTGDAQVSLGTAVSGVARIANVVAAPVAAKLGIDLNARVTQPATGLSLNLLGHPGLTAKVSLPKVDVNAALGAFAAAGLSPDLKLGSLFSVLDTRPNESCLSIGDILNTTGGGVKGLLRNAVTAIVNAEAIDNFPCNVGQIIHSVNAAIKQGVSSTINTLSNQLDGCNDACGVSVQNLLGLLKGC